MSRISPKDEFEEEFDDTMAGEQHEKGKEKEKKKGTDLFFEENINLSPFGVYDEPTPADP